MSLLVEEQHSSKTPWVASPALQGTCNPSTGEVETRGSEVQGRCQLQSKYKSAWDI